MTQEHSLSTREETGPLTVGILLFPEVEVLDFAGPYEVFSVAARIAPKALRLGHVPFTVITVAEASGPVTARHGLQVLPDYSFSNAPPLDLVIVPGGVIAEPLSSRATLDWLRDEAARAVLTASVCTGAFILARIGLLDGLRATTHWEDIEEMRRMFPRVTVVEGPAFIDQGAIVTSAGISAGISMCLHLVGRMVEPELARLTARQMQYDWSAAAR
jgi:transcriptional regulator GlxA family with amidase domain